MEPSSIDYGLLVWQTILIISFVILICGLIAVVVRFALTGRTDQPGMSTKNWLVWMFKSFFYLFKSQK